jgi:hypothetical protein
MSKKRNEERGIHLSTLISTVRSCGVSFNIWQKKNADGKVLGSMIVQACLAMIRRFCCMCYQAS